MRPSLKALRSLTVVRWHKIRLGGRLSRRSILCSQCCVQTTVNHSFEPLSHSCDRLTHAVWVQSLAPSGGSYVFDHTGGDDLCPFYALRSSGKRLAFQIIASLSENPIFCRRRRNGGGYERANG